MAWRSKPETGAPPRDGIENILGRSSTICGDLDADGAFRIDGTIEGSVKSRAAVVIGETGVVRGSVSGSDVVVAGQIQGDVKCSGHLEILAKGKVEGDIDALSVRIETGGVFRGTSRMGKEEKPEKQQMAIAAVAVGAIAAGTVTVGATPTEELSGANAEAA